MTACADFKEDISAFVDGELDAGRQSEISTHISSCGECHTFHTQMKQTSGLLAQSKLSAVAKCPDIWAAMADKMPTICQTIEEDFSAYLDGELIVPAKEGVSEHLQACSPCHGKFQDLSQVNGMLARAFELPGSIEVDLWSQIKSRLDEDCQLIRDDLSSYYDREVTPERHRTITGHLLECADCRDQLQMITQGGDLLRNHYQPDFPENFDLWPEIKAKMQVVQMAPREKRKKEGVGGVAFLRPIHVYAATAAVAIGVLAGVSLLFNVNTSPSVRPVTAESYLIESALGEPADMAEAMVYENQ